MGENSSQTVVNGTIQCKVDTVIYGVHQISETKIVVGGGGGNEVNINMIAILEYVSESGFRIAEKMVLDKDDVVWEMAVNNKRKIICFTTTTKLVLLKFEENNEIKQKCSIELKSKDEEDRDKKFVNISSDGTKVIVCDDFNNIQIFQVSEDYQLTLKQTIPNANQTLNFNDLKIIDHQDDIYIAATVTSTSTKNTLKRLAVWKYAKDGSYELLLDEDSVPKRDTYQFKKCAFSKTNQGLFLLLMCTGNRTQPTVIVKYKINNSKLFYQNQSNVFSKACPVMCTSRENEEEGFIGIGTPDNGVVVYNVDTFKKYSDVQKIHGLGVTCCDVLFLKDQNKIIACTGSIDKHVAVHDVKATAPSGSNLVFYIAFLVLLLAIYMYLGK
ncbi:hypothetical protein AKO1_015443 [Acrasis kona]|uniref:Uncharacterized protein n=1 Tax=Acrasis kona TaxID=1008807 RepID=A0AAW2YJZ2_9EUKA